MPSIAVTVITVLVANIIAILGFAFFGPGHEPIQPQITFICIFTGVLVPVVELITVVCCIKKLGGNSDE